jgi:hypothetical protein
MNTGLIKINMCWMHVTMITLMASFSKGAIKEETDAQNDKQTEEKNIRDMN